MTNDFILLMEQVGIKDVPRVGGKNASLGEMIQALTPKGIRVPSGFIVTADAYRFFMQKTGLDAAVAEALLGLDTKDVRELACRGKDIRKMIVAAQMPKELEFAIRSAYADMEKRYVRDVDVAVRSSATAEDLPGASFAGEHETYLGIRGADGVIKATQSAFASLFTDRAISYRVDKGFAHADVALSVGVQKMVRSDKGASGVMFTVDTESGFKDVVVIDAIWGLGEMIVQGKTTPDEYRVFKKKLDGAHVPIISKTLGEKAQMMVYGSGTSTSVKQTKILKVPKDKQESFVLTDEEVLTLADWGVKIEEHYSAHHGTWTPMDMEWAKDGESGELYIVQARPETVQARRDFSKMTEYTRQGDGDVLVKGISVGSMVAQGKVRVILDPKKIHEFKAGEVLVTDMTDPDWEPIMKIAAAIVTDKGGRTSHAAIVSRELGIPAIVGSGNATKKLKTGMEITVDTTGTDGLVFAGTIPFKKEVHDVGNVPELRTHVMVNVASPDHAFESSFLPVTGVGLAREEFIIASAIGAHPLALMNYEKMSAKVKKQLDAKTKGWDNKVAFYVDNLAYGIGTIGAAFYPRPVIVRFSDFKTNEYRSLLGGEDFEPKEENPMIGWRGASRYYDDKFKEAFALECRAIAKVRGTMGLDNVIPMIPFCRTTKEADATLETMAKEGLVSEYAAKRGIGGTQKNTPVYMMCEIPSNVLLADEFFAMFDGMSIGSNDLTQLTLGLDRDAGILAHIGNENNEAVRKLIAAVIKKAKEKGKYIGICGQGPSDLPDFAQFLVREGIESMSLNPDSVMRTIPKIAEAEQEVRHDTH